MKQPARSSASVAAAWQKCRSREVEVEVRGAGGGGGGGREGGVSLFGWVPGYWFCWAVGLWAVCQESFFIASLLPSPTLSPAVAGSAFWGEGTALCLFIFSSPKVFFLVVWAAKLTDGISTSLLFKAKR